MRHIRSLFALVASLIALPACAEDKAGPKDNMPPEGFVALFNGKDLTGWKGHIDMNERKKPEAEAYCGLQACGMTWSQYQNWPAPAVGAIKEDHRPSCRNASVMSFLASEGPHSPVK